MATARRSRSRTDFLRFFSSTQNLISSLEARQGCDVERFRRLLSAKTGRFSGNQFYFLVEADNCQ
ncbi:MAG: hypothetical protein ACI9HK_002169 [Pirellulaceae bacterium]